MNSTLTIIGTLIIAIGLRSCKTRIYRKLGALTFLILSGMIVYFLTGRNIWAGIFGTTIWFLLPLFQLLGTIRKLRLPLNNKLSHRFPPNEDLFPNADATIAALEDAGFEHAANSGWDWAGSSQSYQFFWHPEERSVAAVCFCKQSKITFSFLTITSRDSNGTLWRTTNYPFSQNLKESPNVWQNNISCKTSCLNAILSSHHYFITLHGACHDDLIIPDPDAVDQDVEQDMRRQIDFNLESGIIELTGDGHFKYSWKGLMFLWKQFIKDMIKLC